MSKQLCIFTCFFALLLPFTTLAQSSSEICQGDSILLRPTVSYETIEWRDSNDIVLTKIDGSGVAITDTAPRVSPTSTATYTARIVDISANNLIPWGDFETVPPSGFSSITDYKFFSGPNPDGFNATAADYNQGFFTVTYNPELLHDQTQFPTPSATYPTPWYINMNDHTIGDGTGNMFVANGSITPSSEVIKATVSVTAGTTYTISAWFANIHTSYSNPYKMDIYIDGRIVGQLKGSSNKGWYQHSGFWTATTTKTVDIIFRNTQIANGSGNDFAIDDIIFSPIVEETYEVVVNQRPVSDFFASTYIGCSPLTIDFITAQVTDNYFWSFGDNTSSDLRSVQKTYVSDSTIIYDVELLVVDSKGCRDSLTKQVDVGNAYAKFTVDDYIKRYPESTFTIHNTGLKPATQYSWIVYNNDSTLSPRIDSTEIFNITFNTKEFEVNEYNIKLVAENARCKDSTTRQITVIPLKSVTPDSLNVTHSDLEGCAPFTVDFKLNDSNNFDTVIWSIDGVAISGGDTFSHEFTGVGPYYVSVNAEKPSGVNVTNSYSVITSYIDTINFIVANNPAEVFAEEVQFQSQVVADSVLWNFGDNANSTIFHPRHIYKLEGDYDVQLIAYKGKCVDTLYKSEAVTIISNSYITFPNAFAPSEESPSDGSFEIPDRFSNIFHPHFNGIKKYELYIFNKWGEEIFFSEEPEIGWNGKYANTGGKVTQGVYFWKAVGTYYNNKNWERSGSVTVIWQ